MRNQLISYIDLLFAGNPNTEDIKQEILQNTLDRYDDLIAQGKSPEAAYSLAISGIGDISEILNGSRPQPEYRHVQEEVSDSKKNIAKILQAVAIALFILCPVPVVILQDEIGVVLLLVMVAIGTALMVVSSSQKQQAFEDQATPQQKLRKSIRSAIITCGVAAYFVISFATGAWFITWLVFPITGAINEIVSACMDLKEAKKYEK